VLRAPATALALIALLLAGCGDEDGAAGPGAAIPADAPVYLEADISGAGEQHEQLDALLDELGEIPLLGTPIDPNALITEAIEDLGRDNGVEISFAEDFEPWLGDSIALGYTSFAGDDPGFVLSIAVDDEEVARDALERITGADAAQETEAEYDGVPYLISGSGGYAVAVFDEQLVLSSVNDFELAVDASRGDSLADSDELAEAAGVLPDERLATLYVDLEGVGDQEAESDQERAELDAVRSFAPELFSQPLVAGVVAGDRTLALDVATGKLEDIPEVAATSRLGEAPGDAFAAMAVAALGEQLSAALSRLEPLADATGHSGLAGLAEEFERRVGVSLDEVLAGAGDAVAYGRGELPGDFVAALDVDFGGESDAAARMLEGLERIAGKDDETVLGPPLGGGDGFSAEPTPEIADTTPVTFINAELGDDGLRLLAAADKAAAEEPPPGGSLADDERFQAASSALGEDYAMVGFADLEPILDAAVGGGSILELALGDVPPERAIAGFLASKLGFAGLGVRYEGDFAIQRLQVGLR
jgi:hypothetical protein